jgi:hypothetical protein
MREPDIEAIIKCERSTPFWSGYRPAHLIRKDYLTNGVHNYYDREFISVGESALGTITFFHLKYIKIAYGKAKKFLSKKEVELLGMLLL